MSPLIAIFINMSVMYNVPPGLLDALCYVESGHNIHAIHKDDGPGGDSLGICQIQLRTAHELGFKGTAKQLMNPKMNIKYAAKYLSRQIARYNGNTRRGVIAYNIGHAGNLTSSRYQRKVYKQWRGKKW